MSLCEVLQNRSSRMQLLLQLSCAAACLSMSSFASQITPALDTTHLYPNSRYLELRNNRLQKCSGGAGGEVCGHKIAGRKLGHLIGDLRLRGGWEEDEDDDSEYEDWSDEDYSSYEEEDEPDAAAAENNPENTWVAGKKDGQIDGLRRANEGITDEEAMHHPILIPLGGWSGGVQAEAEKIKHRYFVEGRAKGPMEADSVPPMRIADVYGLGNWTYLQGEMPEPNYTEANLDYERSILRVPPEELPAIFHYPMGNSHIGSTLDDPTLASRFANWTGPLPTVWQAIVYTPKGRLFAYSFSKNTEVDAQELTEDLGGEECHAFFMDVTERLYEEGARHVEMDGTFEPGPPVVGYNNDCGTAEGVDPTPPTGPDVRERIVPDDHPYVFQAVREREEGERVLCRAGRRSWAMQSQQYPRWAIEVGWQDEKKSLHLRGEGSGLTEEFLTEGKSGNFASAIEGGGVTELHGQWVLSNETYGSFVGCRLLYETSLKQTVLCFNSGPWVVDDCDIVCAHGICIQVSYEGLLSMQRSRVGGTGPDYTIEKEEPGHAAFGVDVEGNGNVTLSKMLLRDIGLHTGGMDDSVVRGCRVTLQMEHFPDVKLKNCTMIDVIQAAFWSECYGMIPERFRGEFEDLEAFEHFRFDESGRSQSSLKDDPRNVGMFGEEEDRGLGGDCRQGRLELEGCSVDGQVWLTPNRPFSLHSDDPSLL